MVVFCLEWKARKRKAEPCARQQKVSGSNLASQLGQNKIPARWARGSIQYRVILSISHPSKGMVLGPTLLLEGLVAREAKNAFMWLILVHQLQPSLERVDFTTHVLVIFHLDY